MSVFQEIIRSNEGTILSGWMGQLENSTRRSDLMNDNDLRRQGTELLRLFASAVQSSSDVQSEPFAATREFLKDAAKSRMEQGFTAAETALFVLSLQATGICCVAQFREERC